MPRTWSPEQRQALADAQRKRWEAKRAKPESTDVASEASKVEQQLSGANAPQLNPIATDVLPEKKQERRSAPQGLRPASPPAIEELHQFSVASLVSELELIPLASVSYADCGTLLNALAVCSTAVALARRQKQEQLEAGTHRAPCKTCGRMIDISKPGGFQILTERDQFHMPMNSYYCSQNCLLARNMPSHSRQTPKEKRANQA
jgi:hypothetical protein